MMVATLRRPTEMLPNSDVEADVALSRCAPSGPRSLTPVVRQTAKTANHVAYGDVFLAFWRASTAQAPVQVVQASGTQRAPVRWDARECVPESLYRSGDLPGVNLGQILTYN
jgi:hypothetical protein